MSRNSIANQIAAGVMSAVLSFGAHCGGSYAGTRAAEHREYVNHAMQYNAHPSERSRSSGRAPSYSSNYSDQLSSWLDGIGYRGNSSLKSMFMSNMSDADKYKVALDFYGAISGKSGGSKPEADSHNNMYLESYDTSNGCYVVDRRKGRIVASLKKTGEGMLFTGPKEYITFFGGRQEGGGMADRIYDGMFHNKN